MTSLVEHLFFPLINAYKEIVIKHHEVLGVLVCPKSDLSVLYYEPAIQYQMGDIAAARPQVSIYGWAQRSKERVGGVVVWGGSTGAFDKRTEVLVSHLDPLGPVLGPRARHECTRWIHDPTHWQTDARRCCPSCAKETLQ